jgi:nicotinamide mononucleotide transporter
MIEFYKMESKVGNKYLILATEWLAVISNLAFTFLYIQQNEVAFVFGIIGPLFIAILSWKRKLFADVGLQMIYVMLTIWGMFYMGAQWEIKPITNVQHLVGIVSCFSFGTILGLVLKKKSMAELPLADSLITAFSIWATALMMMGCRENWLYFMVIDLACIFLFWNRNLRLLSGLYLVYLILALEGYFQWGWITK